MLQKAGIEKKRSPHKLRPTHATNWLNAGVERVDDTAGEFDGRESYAAPALGAKEAKVDCRVLARGRSVSQASTRTMFMAMAVTTC